MCGLAGRLNFGNEPASHVDLRRMGEIIAHRGPDGEGTFVDGPLGFAHRRLAIIDLSPAGHQPMATADGQFVMVYNGEVYNYQELRVELEALGHQFRSRTDSEVVLLALAEWGVDALHKFNGMFALALWDSSTRELLLARDRFGIKPLYYTERPRALLFGSEVKALLTQPELKAQMDLEGLVEYFTFQNFFTDRTLFDGVLLLPAGTWMRVRLDPGGRPTVSRGQYWDFNFAEPEQARDTREYLEELDRLFRQAVVRQLVSDVPVGSYLSGGMDSGSITAIAASHLPHLRTFTVGFDLSSASGLELGYDERKNAEHMSYLLGTEQYEMVLKAGDMERVMPALTWHLEEPRVGQSYPNFYAAGLASKFGKVVLSGGGGDELFGGYPWRYYRAVTNDSFEDYIDKYYAFWQRLIPNSAIHDVFRPVCDSVKNVWTRDIFRDVFRVHHEALTQPEDYVNHSLYLEAKTFLHGLLVMEDKLSMAHSLETRVPFLDNDLVDFAMCLPVNQKLGNLADVVRLDENEPGGKAAQFYQRTKDGKLLLRTAMGRYVPAAVVQREKQGFSAPDASWFRGESIDYVQRTLMQGTPTLFEYLDADAVRGLVREHLDGRKNRRLLVWSLLSVEQWCRTFLLGERPAAP